MRFQSLAAASFLVAGCLAAAQPATAQMSAFYAATPAELAAGPAGSLIRAEELRGPWGSKAYRILYRSTGLNGEIVPVSGILVVPTAAAPARGHPVVAWAHPTTGVADKCAPSLMNSEVFQTIQGVDLMVQRGYVVVATDYPGLGTEGQHPYLVGVSEGRAVLDSVRAARQFAGASNRFAVWGHSQGGHAALWTGEIAAEYAPDLAIVGVAAAAPASLLGKLFDDDLGTTSGEGLTALTLWAWHNLYSIPLGSVVDASDVKSVEAIGGECLSGFTDFVTDVAAIGHIASGDFMHADPVKTQPWAGIIIANTPGKKAAGAPVFIAQGSADVVVDPPVTTEFATLLCNQGTPVKFHEVPDATHTIIAHVSAAAAVEWIAARFAGEPPPTNCVKK